MPCVFVLWVPGTVALRLRTSPRWIRINNNNCTHHTHIFSSPHNDITMYSLKCVGHTCTSWPNGERAHFCHFLLLSRCRMSHPERYWELRHIIVATNYHMISFNIKGFAVPVTSLAMPPNMAFWQEWASTGNRFCLRHLPYMVHLIITSQCAQTHLPLSLGTTIVGYIGTCIRGAGN